MGLMLRLPNLLVTACLMRNFGLWVWGLKPLKVGEVEIPPQIVGKIGWLWFRIEIV